VSSSLIQSRALLGALATLAALAMLTACGTTPEHAGGSSTAKADDLDLGPRLGRIGDSNILREKGWHVWGASVLKGEDGFYHMFYARWPEGMVGRDPILPSDKRFEGMRGWNKYSEIAYARSDSPAGPYVHQRTILRGTNKALDWDRFTAHNPHVKQFGDKVYLYYISNNPVLDKDIWYSHIGGQCIGVIVADSVGDLAGGKFKRPEQPIIRPDGVRTFHRAVNPSVTRGWDDRYYMMFKSYNTVSGRGGHMCHWMAIADDPAGPFTLAGPAFDKAEFAAEDPYLWFDEERRRFYAIVKNFRKDGALGKQRGALALVTSADGLHDWKPAAHPLVTNRRYVDDQGQERTLAHIERPQLLFDEQGRIQCLFAAASYKNPFRGAPTFNLHIPIR